jgi:hypothetical protein
VLEKERQSVRLKEKSRLLWRPLPFLNRVIIISYKNDKKGSQLWQSSGYRSCPPPSLSTDVRGSWQRIKEDNRVVFPRSFDRSISDCCLLS